MVRRVGAAPGENRAYRMKLMRPALPRRAGSASLVSETRMPKPGTRLSNTSTRWPRGAGGSDFEQAVGEQSLVGHQRKLPGLGLRLGYKPSAHLCKCVRTSAHVIPRKRRCLLVFCECKRMAGNG